MRGARRERGLTDKGIERIGAFSDGVFAIAVTLLVLDLKPPEPGTGGDLPQQVLALTPKFFTFVLSFLVVGLYWMAHQRVLTHVRRYDRTFLYLNLLFLMGITFVPFPTSLLGQRGDEPFGAAFYAGSLAVTGLLSSALWWYAARNRRLVEADLAKRHVRYLLVRGLAAPAIFLLSIPIAYLIGPFVAELFWTLIWPSHQLANHLFDPADPEEEQAPESE